MKPLATATGRSEPSVVQSIIETATTLVGFATESGTPNLSLIDWIGKELIGVGARVETVAGPKGRANLFASIGPAVEGGLLLSAHTDVVAAGDGWATPPYGLSRSDDNLVGRGAADMKGFIAVVVELHRRIDAESLTYPVHVALSYDEEVGCAGVGSLLESLVDREDVKPALVLVGEPTMMRPRHRHLGKVAYELTFRASSGHSSRSHSMPSALSSAARVAVAIAELNGAYRPQSLTAEPEVSLNCGTIRGGQAINVIADKCELNFEVRFSTDFEPGAVLAPVMQVIEGERDVLRPVGGDVELVKIVSYPALHTDVTLDVVRTVERLADCGPTTAIGFGTEGGLFAEALGAPVLICGPGDIAVAHRPDEYVSIEQLLRCDRFLAQLIDAFCVAPEIQRR